MALAAPAKRCGGQAAGGGEGSATSGAETGPYKQGAAAVCFIDLR